MANIKTILVIAQKGGVGKTFAADELAYSFERTRTPYVFNDLDGQGNAAHAGHSDPDAVVRIVDTPGRLEDAVLVAIEAADVVVVPTRPTGDDMRTLVTTMRAVRNANPDAPIVMVVNAMNRYTLATKFAGWVEENCANGRIPSCTQIVQISQSEVVSQSRAVRESVIGYQRGSKSAGEVLVMVNAIRRAADLPDETLPDASNRKQPTVSKATKEKAAATVGFRNRMAANRAANMSVPVGYEDR